MFAYVYYNVDKQTAKVPTGFIKKFSKDDYNAERKYKVFWSREIHSIQNENDSTNMEKLGSLRQAPEKHLWNRAEGDGYYSAYVLRIEDTLDALIESIHKKRPTVPAIQNPEDFSTTTEEESFMSQKENKKKEEAEMKKKQEIAKRERANKVLERAKKSRKNLNNLSWKSESEMETDSEDDPEVIPKTLYMQLKESYDQLEKEKEEVENKVVFLEKKLKESEKEKEDMKEICNEVVVLRSLNRQLQESLLAKTTQGGCIHAEGEKAEGAESDPEKMEVELGEGILLNRNLLKEIFDLNDIKKFTKSLAVAIWGTETLATRSVRGKACRNKNGPKKLAPGTVQTVQHDSKPPLTPQKLAVISGQMREFMKRKGRDETEIEKEVKRRNRYISDKIQDICSSMARAEARKKIV